MTDKIDFIAPSTLENIDEAMLKWLDQDINVFTDTNDGWKKVPVIWGNAERSFMIKNNPDKSDLEGTIILPVITIQRTSTVKNLANRSVFGAHIFPPKIDQKGGVVQIAARIMPEKTKEFVNSDAKRQFNQETFPNAGKYDIQGKPVVWEILYSAYPSYLEMIYTIKLRSEYMEQLNDMIAPFIGKTGGINSFLLKNNGHQYEAFIQDNFDPKTNAESMTNSERKFETNITIKVLGYINGSGKNDAQPKVVIRETAAKFRFQRERTIVGDSPEIKKAFYRD